MGRELPGGWAGTALDPLQPLGCVSEIIVAMIFPDARSVREGCSCCEEMGMEPVTLPVVTPEQMAEVERLMVDEYHISQLQMMENAGRSLALLAKQMLDNDLADRPVVVL